MKAIVYTQYGPPEMLKLQERDMPTPKDHQVVVKVHAASLNALEYRRFEGQSMIGRVMDERLMKTINTIFGVDVAGTVVTAGSAVTEFKPGDEVFGVAPGSFAEYVCNGVSKLVRKPANVSFEAAASTPVAALTALQGLRDTGKIQAGQKVLIYGASGGVGLFAVQIAKSYGAEVTAVCRTRNVDLVRSIGADHVIDYTKEDVTQGSQRYDLIFAVNGDHPIAHYRRILTPNGMCVMAGGSMRQIFQAILLGPIVSLFSGRKVKSMGIASTPKEDLLVIRDLLEAGKLTPVIDRCYPLSETVDAINYLLHEHARGKVIITPTAA